jgi:hypothetical protein
MERNSCRNPWFNLLNARISWSVPTVRAQQLTLRFDIQNVLNLLDEDWGLLKETSSFEGQQIVRMRAWDAANQRGSYDITLPTRGRLNSNLNRWAMQLGASYSF